MKLNVLVRVPRSTRVPRPLLIANVIMVGLAVFFAVSLTRELSHAREVPPPRIYPPQATALAASSEPSAITTDRLDTYNVIAAKHLFSPSRNEVAATQVAAAAESSFIKPLLHGVIVDGDGSMAYLEDPGSKRVVAYRIGDSLAGGKLVQIDKDRVSISRADTQVDILLKDPAKPQPQPAPTPTQPTPATRTQNRPVNPPDQPTSALAPAAAQPPRSGAVRVPRTLPSTPSEAANPPQPAPAED
jgi:hypothetical protein